MAPKSASTGENRHVDEEAVPLVRSRGGGSPASVPWSHPGDPPTKPKLPSSSSSSSIPVGYRPPSSSADDSDLALAILKLGAAVKSLRPLAVFGLFYVVGLGLVVAGRHFVFVVGGGHDSPSVADYGAVDEGGVGGGGATGAFGEMRVADSEASKFSTANEARLSGEGAPAAGGDLPAGVSSSSAGYWWRDGDGDGGGGGGSEGAAEAGGGVTSPLPPPVPIPAYGDMSCPLEDPLFSAAAMATVPWYDDPEYLQRTAPHSETRQSFVDRGESARLASLEAHAPLRIRAGVRRGFEGKVVLVGGEEMRQYFISLGCLGGFRPGSFVAPWRSEEGQASRARQGKVKLDAKFTLLEEESRNFGEILYSPLAGYLLTYSENSPSISRGEMLIHEQSMSWLEACKAGEPFTLDSYGYHPNGDPGPVHNLKLFATDTVFLNAGTDPLTRSRNMNAIVELMDCVEEKRKKGWATMTRAAKDWPRLRYVMTGLSHPASGNAPKCDTQNYSGRHQVEDVKKFHDRLALPEDGRPFRQVALPDGTDNEVLVARDVNLANHGDMHVRGQYVDCDSWFQPGVPDVVAAQLVESVVGRIDVDAALAEWGEQGVASLVDPLQAQVQGQQVQGQPVPMAATEQGQPVQMQEAQAEAAAEAPRAEEDATAQKQANGMPTPQALLDSCPFVPNASSGSVNLDPNLAATMERTDLGFMGGLRKLLGRGRNKSVLDLAAGAGQLRSSLGDAGWLAPRGAIDYVGFEQYLNIEQLVGETLLIHGASHEVPPLCWADPSRPFDLERKFDLVLAVVGPGQFVRQGGEMAFLDNVVRAAFNLVVVAWNTAAHNGDINVMEEMERRGMVYDRMLTSRLRGSTDTKGWLGKTLEVYKYKKGTSKPLAGERR